MIAFKLKACIEDLLDQHSGDRFVVVGPYRKADAENIFKKPTVLVFYSEGSFDKSKSSVNSPYHHDASFNIHLSVAAKATSNLAVLQNPEAKPEQYAIALAASNDAVALADAKTDELIAIVYDIIMRPEHRKLGFDDITSRWVPQINKYQPSSIGAIVTSGATITLKAQTAEKVTSAITTLGETIDTVIDLDDESKQGVKT